MDQIKQKLHSYYNDKSKHANYQNVPEFVREQLGYDERIDEEWRGDTARFSYIVDNVAFVAGQTIGDVGANTGFFTLSLAHLYAASRFLAFEVNQSHADHIRLIVEAFEMNNVGIESLAVDLAGVDELPALDILLHLNVLHHAGHDFDAEMVSEPGEMMAYAVEYLSKLSRKVSTLVFQIGYNWGGDKSKPIISPTDQPAMVLWLKRLFMRSGWEIEDIAFAMRDEGRIRYQPLAASFWASNSVDLLALQEEIDTYRLHEFRGEFYRRPIVVCRSLNAGNA